MLKWLLVPLGLLTAILLAAPQLVIVGLIFLILPGLMLAITPTVFVYLLAVFSIRWALPPQSRFAANATSCVLAIVMSAVVMQPGRWREQARFTSAAIPDIAPVEKIQISGNVLVDWPESRASSRGEIPCDSLCVALLDTPGVTSVTRRDQRGAATFRRGAGHAGVLVLPEEPQEILAKFAKLADESGKERWELQRQTERTLQADWALRIARGDELRRDAASRLDYFDWTIRLERRREKQTPDVDRLEIQDRQGEVRARSSLVRHFVPAPLFYLGFDGGSSVDGFGGAKFSIGGTKVSNRPLYYDFDGTVELLRVVEIPRPAPQPESAEQLELALHEALDNPSATEAQLLLAPMWLSQFQYNAKEEQIETIAKILADDRVIDPALQLQKALSSQTELTRLRAGLVKRFHSASDDKARNWYIKSLVGLPDGTFAEPTDEERMIWNQALEVNEAAPFVARMADVGGEATPKLLTLIEEATKRPWHARWRTLEGVRVAFQRLGPAASQAVPRIQTWIEASPSALLNTYGDRMEWLVALRRMGVPADDLPLGVKNQTPAERKSDLERVERRAERYHAT